MISVISDRKNHVHVYKTSYYQIAAYSEMIKEMGIEVYGGLVVHTNNNKIKGGIQGLKTHYISGEEIPGYWDHFLTLKKVWDYTSTEKPKYYLMPQIFDLDSEINLN